MIELIHNNKYVIIFTILLIISIYFYTKKEHFDTLETPDNINNMKNDDKSDKKFEGITYRLPDNWNNLVKLDEYKNRPIKYVEIGTFYGANILAVAESYGANPDSKLYCIDPWEDYEEYPEYKGEQNKIYNGFLKNINNSPHKNKIIIDRGYSNKQLLKYNDDYFDIVYIDGNHEPEYVLEDAVLSFRKLKKDGVMIFDDYGWGGPDLTQRGIDAFISGYYKRIKVLGNENDQMFIQRIS
jgi:predicted O-methyltransferase YrrM